MFSSLLEALHALDNFDEPCALCSLASEMKASDGDLKSLLDRKASQCTAEEADVTAQIELKMHARERLQFELKKVDLSIAELEKQRRIIRHKRSLSHAALSKLNDGHFSSLLSASDALSSEITSDNRSSMTNFSHLPTSHAIITPKQNKPTDSEHVRIIDPTSEVPKTRIEDLIRIIDDETVAEPYLLKALNQFESFCLLSISSSWNHSDLNSFYLLLSSIVLHMGASKHHVQAVELRIIISLLKRSINQEVSVREPFFQRVTVLLNEADSLQLFNQLLKSENEDVRTEAAELLTLACVENSMKEKVAQFGIIQSLLETLQSSSQEHLIEKTLVALWHQAMNDSNKAHIRELNGMEIIISLLDVDSHAIVENVTIALGYLTRDDTNKLLIRKNNGIEKLISTLHYPSYSVQSTAAGALWNCASNVDNKIAIRKLGGVAALVNLLNSESESVQENAAGALWNLAVDTENKRLILQLGGLHPLILLLSSRNEAVVENASGTLWNCAAVGENRIALRKLNGIEPLLRLLLCQNEHIQENAAGAIRNCAINDQNKLALRELGGIELFVDLLDRVKSSVVEKLTSTLWICSINNENKHALRTCGGFPKLLRMLDHENISVKEKTLGILRNCSSIAENRANLIECQAISKIVSVLKNVKHLTSGIKEYAAATMWNLARDDKTMAREQGAIRILAALLADKTEAVVENAAGALLSLTINVENRDHLREIGGVQELVRCLEIHSNEFILENSVGALKNCTASNDKNQTILREFDAIPRIVSLLNLENEGVLREATLCLKNLGANEENRLLLHKCGAISKLQTLQETSKSDAIRKVSAFALQTLSRPMLKS